MDNVLIIRKDVKHINIKVKPSCEVILTAPMITTDEHIAYVLKKRASWISKKLEFYSSNQPASPKQYVSGENFRYLGRNYRLKVVSSDKETVKLQRGYLNIFVKDTNDFDKKERLIKAWYMDRAGMHFQKALVKYQLIVKKDIRSVKIREMKTRWGSCNPSKSYINLNSELIKKPTECIEYVVFHELVHLVYINHSKEFYNYMSVYMPDWKNRKVKLELIY